MKLVVGLWNPGKEYAKTRHNIWWIMLDAFCNEKNIGPWKWEKSFHADIIKNWDVIYCKPLTYMNKSGESVKKICDFYKISAEDILVLHDEIDIPTAKIQKKIWWSHAGHNGLKSMLHFLQNSNSFTRIRIGVDRPATKEQVTDWVLWVFSKAEMTELDKQKEVVSGYISEFIEK